MYKYLKYFFKLSKGSTGGRASNIGLEWRNQSSLQGFIFKGTMGYAKGNVDF